MEPRERRFSLLSSSGAVLWVLGAACSGPIGHDPDVPDAKVPVPSVGTPAKEETSRSGVQGVGSGVAGKGAAGTGSAGRAARSGDAGGGGTGAGAAANGAGTAGTGGSTGASGAGTAGADGASGASGAAGTGTSGAGDAGSSGAAGESAAGSGGASGSGESGGTGGVSGAGATGGSGGNGGMSGASGMGGAAGDASGGTGGTSSTCAAISHAAVTVSGPPPTIPNATAACPTLASGNITVLGQNVLLAVGTKCTETAGPVFFYWHGTGGAPTEAGVMGPAIQEILDAGGLIASFDTSTKNGTDTGNGVWYTGDFAMADLILACAVQQLNIDTRRIYTGGCSAGGLQASAMLYARSSYLAAVMPNSGGILYARAYSLQDATHVPALITTHGAMGSDVVYIDFSTTSATQDSDVRAKGGFVVDCNHGGGHCGAPPEDIAAQWQFCKDHPFGVSPEPYAAALPSSFPSYCTVIH